jgi:hypothetical protein
MQISTIVAVICFIAGVTLLIFSNFIVYMMVGEINANSGPEDQVSMFFLQSKLGTIFSRHRALYPYSRRRRQVYVVGLTGLAMNFVAFVVFISPSFGSG